MNTTSKKLLMGLLLLILHPAAMANALFYDYTQSYSNCSVKLLDDGSVKVSFQANLTDGLFGKAAGGHRINWKKLINISDANLKNTSLHSRKALLSLYFYNADDSPNLNIKLQDLHDISLNGINHDRSSNNIKEIKFESNSSAFNITRYYVSFTVNANALKNIRIGVTVGGVLVSNEQKYPLFSSRGVSFSPSGNQCESFDPQANMAPSALKVDPKFRLASATWQLRNIDLDDLLDKTADGRGLHAPLTNPATNRFCISYRAIGIQNTRYMISASNRNGLAPNNRHFQLKENKGNSIINYNVALKSDEYVKKDFSLPRDKKSIQLKADNHTGEEQMCWSPKIRIYSTNTTDKGSYSDTLNFTITPSA
ncbi:TPA: hypothetical protein PXM11_002902 [Yersinia enterocolitica]|uniref:hypothetical protein n=1 Tax=Yersinia enterocolitica TaxID=630 RepID=UPI0032F13816|nr:hypothetical protein [Yersinia enterocolitica]HDL6969202.1 hypothetical protein [Yersinia enterocolitica]HDL6975768.1 hypothetical protein [Yersinia enterocolitica]HDL6988219.1 hypothetical protein [Yersinia enterocolitica]HDL6996800.1 hypothetical protein [Yersinia enterocolitica]